MIVAWRSLVEGLVQNVQEENSVAAIWAIRRFASFVRLPLEFFMPCSFREAMMESGVS